MYDKSFLSLLLIFFIVFDILLGLFHFRHPVHPWNEYSPFMSYYSRKQAHRHIRVGRPPIKSRGRFNVQSIPSATFVVRPCPGTDRSDYWRAFRTNYIIGRNQRNVQLTWQSMLARPPRARQSVQTAPSYVMGRRGPSVSLLVHLSLYNSGTVPRPSSGVPSITGRTVRQAIRRWWQWHKMRAHTWLNRSVGSTGRFAVVSSWTEILTPWLTGTTGAARR
ncbi:hypothetical protein LY76DRAFT_597407 [Colletotrichum caudatum]|nr:hypothetical protein LY76DRAFT_597407 [Colletotrichum caudatum]